MVKNYLKTFFPYSHTYGEALLKFLFSFPHAYGEALLEIFVLVFTTLR